MGGGGVGRRRMRRGVEGGGRGVVKRGWGGKRRWGVVMRGELQEEGRRKEVWRRKEKEDDIKIKFDESVSGCTLQSAIFWCNYRPSLLSCRFKEKKNRKSLTECRQHSLLPPIRHNYSN